MEVPMEYVYMALGSYAFGVRVTFEVLQRLRLVPSYPSIQLPYDDSIEG
jgi:hypothetical protein